MKVRVNRRKTHPSKVGCPVETAPRVDGLDNPRGSLALKMTGIELKADALSCILPVPNPGVKLNESLTESTIQVSGQLSPPNPRQHEPSLKSRYLDICNISFSPRAIIDGRSRTELSAHPCSQHRSPECDEAENLHDYLA
mmetsp:Transcript_16544/g.33820  ORF Transcript_16544/g.33820 Transcript_16544/m.33820 type:complete len:140 (+) Transcript_16544:4129-4548(+)